MVTSASCDGGALLPFSLSQAVLAICSLSLLLKKLREGQARSWPSFLLDASKQLIGAGWALLLEAHAFDAGTGTCEDRWMRSLLDATFVVLVELLALSLVAAALAGSGSHAGEGDLVCGEYQDPKGSFVLAKYMKQLAIWLGAILCAEWAMSTLLSKLSGELNEASGAMLSVVSWSPGLENVVVGLIGPCAGGALKVWLTDDFLCAGGSPWSQGFAALLVARLPVAAQQEPQLPSWVQRPETLERPLLQGINKADRPDGQAVSATVAASVRRLETPPQKVSSARAIADPFPMPAERMKDVEEAFPELKAAMAGLDSAMEKAVNSAGTVVGWQAGPEYEYVPRAPVSPLQEDVSLYRDSAPTPLSPLSPGGSLPPPPPGIRSPTSTPVPTGSGAPNEDEVGTWGTGSSGARGPHYSGDSSSSSDGYGDDNASPDRELVELRRRIGAKNKELLDLRNDLLGGGSHGGAGSNAAAGHFASALGASPEPGIRGGLVAGAGGGRGRDSPSTLSLSSMGPVEQPGRSGARQVHQGVAERWPTGAGLGRGTRQGGGAADEAGASRGGSRQQGSGRGQAAISALVRTTSPEAQWGARSGAFLDSKLSTLEAKLDRLAAAQASSHLLADRRY